MSILDPNYIEYASEAAMFEYKKALKTIEAQSKEHERQNVENLKISKNQDKHFLALKVNYRLRRHKLIFRRGLL